ANRKTHGHHVVVLGGGFAGLYAAKNLRGVDVDVTLIDKRNFHLFQPLLYQVATGGLSPGDISSPLRAVLKRSRNTRVWQAEVLDIHAAKREITLRDGALSYDTLVVATGVTHTYFGNDRWREFAPGLKTIEDALDIRRRVFVAFEAAEREEDPDLRRQWMTFVIVGGGSTGVELAGALGELTRGTLRNDFRSIDPRDTRIVLVEGLHRLLSPFPPELSAESEVSLAKLGVEVRKQTRVTDVGESAVMLRCGTKEERIEARTILWAAGVEASAIGGILARETGAQLDGAGRVRVEADLTVPNHPEIFVIGDLANYAHQGGKPLPGIAPVAMQQGRYVADLIRRRQTGRPQKPFHYQDKGTLAVIGRHAAVADLGRFRFAGFKAWLAWVFVHIWYLIEYDNKILVLVQWAFDYFTRKRGARLITGKDPYPLVKSGPRHQSQ
ncbi:MAG: NAD(P)/FAD-dependent oxidoreductase, partial [Candidatus Krumholzibacteria bacterium]|nr:NAD(P)/FAD-dependent oxidoreductase [Candidatus Krumholzibacteria bacterium]